MARLKNWAKPFTRIAGTFAITFLASTNSLAGAWTLAEGSFKVIPSYTYYASDKAFDASGSSYSSGSKFTKHELSLNTEYGFNNNLTIGATPYLTSLNQSTGAVDDGNQALSSFEIYTRYQLYSSDDLVFSLEPKIKMPGIYSADDTPNMGQRTTDLELAAGLGSNFSLFGRKGFTDVRIAYGNYIDEYFSSDKNPYIKADFTVAVEVVPSWLIMPKLYTNFSLNDPPSTVTNANIVNAKNYTLVKPELNLVKRFSENTAIQIGVFQDVYGKNTGKGQGLSASLWLDF